jgi:hypothetical protein
LQAPRKTRHLNPEDQAAIRAEAIRNVPASAYLPAALSGFRPKGEKTAFAAGGQLYSGREWMLLAKSTTGTKVLGTYPETGFFTRRGHLKRHFGFRQQHRQWRRILVLI